MEVKNTQCTIKGIFGLILCITSIAGLGPLNVERIKDRWRLTISKSVDVYGKFVVLFMCVLAVLTVFTTYKLNPQPFHLQTTSDRILAVLSLTMALPAGLVASWTGLKRMRHLINYLVQIEKINIVLKKYYQQATHNDSQMNLCIVCLLVFGIITVFAEYGVFVKHVLYHNYEVPRQCMYIFYYILVEYIQLISIQFFLTALSILSSFSLLNNCLRNLIMNSKSASTIDMTSKGLAECIHGITRQYFALSDLVYSVNDSHGLLLVQLLMVYLINLSVTPYKILNLLLKSTSIEYDTVAVQFLCLILHISNLVIVIEPCQRTHNEMHKTKILISELMRCRTQSNDAVSLELETFYTSLMSQDITYTPLSMFTTDRTLIILLLGTISTYLTIVLTL